MFIVIFFFLFAFIVCWRSCSLREIQLKSLFFSIIMVLRCSSSFKLNKYIFITYFFIYWEAFGSLWLNKCWFLKFQQFSFNFTKIFPTMFYMLCFLVIDNYRSVIDTLIILIKKFKIFINCLYLADDETEIFKLPIPRDKVWTDHIIRKISVITLGKIRCKVLKKDMQILHWRLCEDYIFIQISSMLFF